MIIIKVQASKPAVLKMHTGGFRFLGKLVIQAFFLLIS
jgi:hypothetical protein